MDMGGVPPFIADEGRDGHPFGVIDLWSDPGAWADALRFSVNIRASDYEPPVEFAISRGMTTIVDRADAHFAELPWVAATKGHVTYAMRSEGRKTVCLHRLIMGAAPGQIVDHINGDGLDNRRSNLRFATRSENRANSRQSKSKLGFRGVELPPGGRRFRARILKNGVWHSRVGFDTAEEAARAYDEMARELFGAFAACNFPDADAILPDEPLKRPLNAAKGNGDTDAPVSAPVVSLSLHSPTDTDERPQDHV